MALVMRWQHQDVPACAYHTALPTISNFLGTDMIDPDTDPDENRGLFQTPRTVDRYPWFGGSTIIHLQK